MTNLFNLYSFTIEIKLITNDEIKVDTKTSTNQILNIVNGFELDDLQTNQIHSFEEFSIEYKGLTRLFTKITLNVEGVEDLFDIIVDHSESELKALIKKAIVEADWDQDLDCLADGSRLEEVEENEEESEEIASEQIIIDEDNESLPIAA